VDKRLARFAIITTLAFIVSRLLGLLRDQIIVAHTGANYQFSAYVLAMQIPDTIFVLLSGGALASTFIPKFLEVKGNKGERYALKLAKDILLVIGIGTLITCTLIWLLTPYIVDHVLLRGSNDPRVPQLTSELLRLVLLQPIFLSLSTVATSILQSYEKFLIPAIAPIFYNLSIIASAIFLYPMFGMIGIASGVVIGAMLFLLLHIPQLARLGLSKGLRISSLSCEVKDILLHMVPRLFCQATIQINLLIAVAFASRIGPAEVAAFRLAWVVFFLPISVFSASIGTVTLPRLSQNAVERELESFRRLLQSSITTVTFIILPASIGLGLISTQVIRLLYEHGKFGRSDTIATASILSLMSLGMVGYGMLDLLPRASYALSKTLPPVISSLVGTICNISIVELLISRMGIEGVVIGFITSALVNSTILIIYLSVNIGNLLDRTFFISIGKQIFASASIVPVIYVTQQFASSNLFLQVLAPVTCGLIVYVLVSVMFRQKELEIIVRSLIPEKILERVS